MYHFGGILVFEVKNQKQNNTFSKEFEKWAAPLTKFVIKRVSGDSRATEEVLSATMVAAWKGFNTFEHKSSYFTWICRIALNKIADYYRDQVHRESKLITPGLKVLANMEDKSPTPEEKMALEDLKKSVNDCLDLMSPEKRQLLQFRYWYDMSYSEISELLGISERAVEGQIYRAKHEFAEVWERKR